MSCDVQAMMAQNDESAEGDGGYYNPKLPAVKSTDVADWSLPDDQFTNHFHVPRAEDRYEILAQLNVLSERDARITFDEEKHVYYVDGVRMPQSCTELLAKYRKPFIAEHAIAKMRKGKNWITKRMQYKRRDGTEMSDEEIAEVWENAGKVSSARGTLMHWQIEQRLNGRRIEKPHSPEFSQFLAFARDWLWHGPRKVYRTEVNLFHTGLRVAGQVDLICLETDGSFSIFDWKRSRHIKVDNPYENMLPPLDHLDDCNMNYYAMQLNLYRYILETEYQRKVSAMYVVVLHPAQNKYEVIEVEDKKKEVAWVHLALQEEQYASPSCCEVDATLALCARGRKQLEEKKVALDDETAKRARLSLREYINGQENEHPG